MCESFTRDFTTFNPWLSKICPSDKPRYANRLISFASLKTTIPLFGWLRTPTYGLGSEMQAIPKELFLIAVALRAIARNLRIEVRRYIIQACKGLLPTNKIKKPCRNFCGAFYQLLFQIIIEQGRVLLRGSCLVR